jgi:hypothetical protein
LSSRACAGYRVVIDVVPAHANLHRRSARNRISASNLRGDVHIAFRLSLASRPSIANAAEVETRNVIIDADMAESAKVTPIAIPSEVLLDSDQVLRGSQTATSLPEKQ